MYIEWLEGQAIATAPLKLYPKTLEKDMWMTFLKSYKGETDYLTALLNQIDPTGCITFTHEEKKEGSFLS